MAKRVFVLVMLVGSLLVGCVGCAVQPPTAVIDWVNFIRFHGITYLASFDAGRELQPSDLGAQYATVRFHVADNVHDPSYRLQDGDAAYLDAGAPIFRVVGYAPTFRLAARQDGRILLYEADTNPQAKTGSDLLDIGGKVESIVVTGDTQAATPVGAISDTQVVDALVTLLLAAPVDQSRQLSGGGTRYFLAFHLTDGTQVNRVYLPDAREVGRGIVVPEAFVSLLATALGKS